MSAHPFSILIPVYDDLFGLKRTLESISRLFQDNPPDVLVCNDGACPATSRHVTDLAFVRECILPDRRGSYAARNVGIRETRTPYIAFIDAGVILSDTWEEAVTKTIADGSGYCAGEIAVYPTDPTDAYQLYETEFSFPVKDYLFLEHYCPTANLLVRKSVFGKIGLFDERLYSSGDKEFGHRVYRGGYRQDYSPEMCVYHDARDRNDLTYKSIRILDGHLELARLHPDYFRPITLTSEVWELAKFVHRRLVGQKLANIGHLNALRIRCALTLIKMKQILNYDRQSVDAVLGYNRV